MLMRATYTFISPIYDAFLATATRAARRASIGELPCGEKQTVLLAGVGSGLDLPHLPTGNRYVGLDLTPAMLRLALRRAENLAMDFVEGDCQALPFADASFDHVIAHLIVAVTPAPERTLAEASRVLKPGGSLLILDKFLPPSRPAPIRRGLNRLTRHLVTRLDVVLETLLAQHPELILKHNRPALASGWFRSVKLTKAQK